MPISILFITKNKREDMKKRNVIISLITLAFSLFTMASFSNKAVNSNRGVINREMPINNKIAANPTVSFTGIAPGWNNSSYGNDSTYRQLILAFGQHGVDYLANNHTADVTNRATSSYDIGNKLTIDGIPIYKIYNHFPSTKVGYDHGYEYFYVQYPIEIFNMRKNNAVVTLHIEAGAQFMDSYLPEVTLKYVGGSWIVTNANDFYLDEPIDFFYHSMVSWPHHFGTEAHAVLYDIPANGSEIGFNINTGNIDLTNTSNTFILDGLYNTTIIIYPSNGNIQLLDKDANNAIVKEFGGYQFAPNADYIFEIAVTCGSRTTFKFAINHFLLFEHRFNNNKSNKCALWVLDTTNQMSMDLYEELTGYQPTIVYGGSSSYDFMEGDPVYNFANITSAFDLYNDDINSANLAYIYEEGAVTNNKYNAGIWELTIKLTANGYKKLVTKTITINVHGYESLVNIYYDDNEPIRVPAGTKLVPPPNPATYQQNGYDYVFDGWYYQGAKWDFENDVVQGETNLYSRFITMGLHYIVTAHYQGINRATDTFSLADGSTFPFDLFAVNGATFEVFNDANKITSLIVHSNVTLTVKYNVVFTYIDPVEPTYTSEGHTGYWYSDVYPNYYFADSRGVELLDAEDVIIPRLKHLIADEIEDADYLLFTPSDYNLVGNDTGVYYGNLGNIFQNSFGFQFNINVPNSDINTTVTRIAFGATDIYGNSALAKLYLHDNTYKFGMFFNGSYDWSTYNVNPEWTPDVNHLVEFYAIKTDSTHMMFLLGFDGELIWKTAAKDISDINLSNRNFLSFYNEGSTKHASYYSSIPTVDKVLERFGERKLSAKDVSFDNYSNTGACLSKYQDAKNFYNTFLTPNQKVAFANNAKYANLKERFIAWGEANGEIISFNAQGALLSNHISSLSYKETPIYLIIVLIITFSTIGFGFIYPSLKNKKGGKYEK